MVWDYNRCVSVLSEEIALIKEIILAQNLVRKAITAREWADFDSKIAQVEQLGERFRLLETERIKIFAAMQKKIAPLDPEPTFYSLAAKLPAKECRKLSSLYRELKMETFRIKALNECFFNYIKEVQTVAVAWLEAVAPGQKLYTRNGRKVSEEPRSMILNHRM